MNTCSINVHHGEGGEGMSIRIKDTVKIMHGDACLVTELSYTLQVYLEHQDLRVHKASVVKRVQRVCRVLKDKLDSVDRRVSMIL